MAMHLRTIFQCTVLLDLFEIFYLEVKGQGPMKVIMVLDTSHYGHALTYEISLTYRERQKCYGPDKKILLQKQLFYLDTPPYGHTPTTQISFTYLGRQKCYGPDKKILFKEIFI